MRYIRVLCVWLASGGVNVPALMIDPVAPVGVVFIDDTNQSNDIIPPDPNMCIWIAINRSADEAEWLEWANRVSINSDYYILESVL